MRHLSTGCDQPKRSSVQTKFLRKFYASYVFFECIHTSNQKRQVLDRRREGDCFAYETFLMFELKTTTC